MSSLAIVTFPLPTTTNSSLALSLQSVSVSFLVVFRNLIAVFVAAFEFFVQVNAPQLGPHEICRVCPLRAATQGQRISLARLGGLLAMLQVIILSLAARLL